MKTAGIIVVGVLERALVGGLKKKHKRSWAATGRSRRSGKRIDEGLALFLGRGRGSRPRLAAAGDGAGRRRQVPRARAAAGSLLQMTSLHGGVESEIYCKTWLCGQVLNFC